MIRRARWALGRWLTRDQPPPGHVVIVEIDGRTICRSTIPR